MCVGACVMHVFLVCNMTFYFRNSNDPSRKTTILISDFFIIQLKINEQFVFFILFVERVIERMVVIDWCSITVKVKECVREWGKHTFNLFVFSPTIFKSLTSYCCWYVIWWIRFISSRWDWQSRFFLGKIKLFTFYCIWHIEKVYKHSFSDKNHSFLCLFFQ